MQTNSIIFLAALGMGISISGSTNLVSSHVQNGRVCAPKPEKAVPTEDFVSKEPCSPNNLKGFCPLINGKQSCCSKYGYCGIEEGHCHIEAGCNRYCWVTDELPKYSVDGKCGKQNNNMKCNPNNPEGFCCSKDGFCGGSDAHCLEANGCQFDCKA